jgi:hypothetical protein
MASERLDGKVRRTGTEINRVEVRSLELRHAQKVEGTPLTEETIVDSDHHKTVG